MKIRLFVLIRTQIYSLCVECFSTDLKFRLSSSSFVTALNLFVSQIAKKEVKEEFIQWREREARGTQQNLSLVRSSAYHSENEYPRREVSRLQKARIDFLRRGESAESRVPF